MRVETNVAARRLQGAFERLKNRHKA
jgi:hypothetical protein